MQIRTKVEDGNVTVEVIDPTDQAVTHYAVVGEAEQITVTATACHSPADIQFGEVEATPGPEPTVEESNAADGEAEAAASEPEDKFGSNGEESDEQGSDPEDDDA